MENPVPFFVILDDPSVEDPDQMSRVIAARLQGDARFVVATAVRYTDEVPDSAMIATPPLAGPRPALLGEPFHG